MTSSKQLEFLARAIVNRLEDRSLVEFGDAEEGIRLVERVLSDNFVALDAIEAEARSRFTKQNGREPKPEELESEMLRLAAERNGVL